MLHLIRRRPRLFKLTIMMSGILLLIGTGIWLIWWLTKPIDVNNSAQVSVVIPKGESIIGIANQLYEKDLIRHPLIFRAVVRQKNLGQVLQAGSFRITPAMNVYEIAQALTQGTEDVWITLLEGWRREEMAAYLEIQKLEYFDKDEFLLLTSSLEGRLFPDTYLVPREVTTSAVVNLLTSTFDQKVVVDLEEEVGKFQDLSGFSLDEIIIMASLVEREARDFEQMRHVAGILWNRIEIGMALQVDATLQYVKQPKIEQTGTINWWAPPLAQDKQLSSPYNTYQNPGLPPGPIANPSLQAIQATIDPLQVDDIFYLHAPDGTMYFAATIEEHNSNINRYLR